ncbi:MAG TPA: methyltransferase domain-containing protein [Alphaproteobacteria bacterium]|nr:methyltransferase domain-containing protein [Alphaproteobacteria bacterium]
MLHGLDQLIARHGADALDEATLYRSERLHRLPRGQSLRPGAYHCPLCGTSAVRFLRFGLAGRRNAQCPACGSLERHRLLWLYLGRHTPALRRRLRVLHTAPEPALAQRLGAWHGRGYVSVDRFDPHADVQADLTDLPFPAGRFDLVITSHTLEHVPDDRRAMAELARVLRPGGRMVVMVPFDPRIETQEDRSLTTPAQRLAAYGHPYHYRIYGRDLSDRLDAAGLTVTVHDARRLLTPHQRRFWRINRNYVLDGVKR